MKRQCAHVGALPFLVSVFVKIFLQPHIFIKKHKKKIKNQYKVVSLQKI